jgi:hypothetical protein
MDTILGQITDVTGTGIAKSIDATIYENGTVENVSFQVDYASLTTEQKATVDAFQALIVSLAPQQ